MAKSKWASSNVDDSPDVATKYGVTIIPRVLFFKGGDKPAKTVVGLVSESELVKTLNGLLEASSIGKAAKRKVKVARNKSAAKLIPLAAWRFCATFQ